jgi:hypothetical protein|nr:MAG TPA: hypothetical protein [Caudoviricetes sp.]
MVGEIMNKKPGSLAVPGLLHIQKKFVACRMI